MVPDKKYVQKSKRFHCIYPYGKKLHWHLLNIYRGQTAGRSKVVENVFKNGDSDVWRTLQSGHSCKVECWVQCVCKFVGKVRILQHLNLANFMGAWTEKNTNTSVSGPIKLLRSWRWQFLDCIMSGDETLRQQYEPELKQQIIKCWQSNSPLKKRFKIQSAVGNVILLFQIEKFVILMGFLKPRQTINFARLHTNLKTMALLQISVWLFYHIVPRSGDFQLSSVWVNERWTVPQHYHSKCHFHWFRFLKSIAFRILFIIDKNI